MKSLMRKRSPKSFSLTLAALTLCVGVVSAGVFKIGCWEQLLFPAMCMDCNSGEIDSGYDEALALDYRCEWASGETCCDYERVVPLFPVDGGGPVQGENLMWETSPVCKIDAECTLYDYDQNGDPVEVSTFTSSDHFEYSCTEQDVQFPQPPIAPPPPVQPAACDGDYLHTT